MLKNIDKEKSDRILQELKKQRRQNRVIDVDEKTTTLVIFLVSESLYAFYGNDVREILPVGKIVYVPGAHEFFLGIINVRGDIESVINIHKILGLPEGKTKNAGRIIITVNDETSSGVLVESVVDVIDIPESAIKSPMSSFSDHVKELVIGETEFDKKNVVILDVNKIFEKITA